jgi:hypothetical protein
MAIKLWELLFVIFFAPACWFGWMWFFRIAAGVVVGKLVSGMKNKVKEAFKNE